MKYRGGYIAPVETKATPATPDLKAYVDQHFETKSAAEKRWQAVAKGIGKGVAEQLKPMLKRLDDLETRLDAMERTYGLEARLAKLEGRKR